MHELLAAVDLMQTWRMAICSQSHRRRRMRILSPLSTPSVVPPLGTYRYRSALLALIALCGIGSSSSREFHPVAYLTASSPLRRRQRNAGCSSSSIGNSRHRALPSKSSAAGVTADNDTNNEDIGGSVMAIKGGPFPTNDISKEIVSPNDDDDDVTKTATISALFSATTSISNIVDNKRSSNSSNYESIDKKPKKMNDTRILNETNKSVDDIINTTKGKNNVLVKMDGSNAGNKRRQQRPPPPTYPSQQPYAHLSVDELRQLTEYHLSRNIRPDGSLSLGTMTPGQRHEFARLISSWSKLSVAVQSKSKSKFMSPSLPSIIKNAAKLTNVTTEEASSSSVVCSLTREEKLLAAEMAEQCLRELIEEENAALTSSSSSSPIDTSTLSSVVTPPDLYYLVIKAWLDVGKGSGGGGGGLGGHGRKGNSSYRDLRHATSLLDFMERQQRKWWQQQQQQQQQLNALQKKRKQRDNRNLRLPSILSVMKCYTVILDGWCKSKMSGSEIKAEEILRRMMTSITMTMTMMEHDGHAGGDDREKVDEAAGMVLVRQYNNVMNRIATSGKLSAGAETERLLYELIAASSLSSLSYLPSQSLDTTLSTAATTTTNDLSFAARAPLLILAPDRITFNTVIKAYANSGGENAIANAERILSVMENYRPPSSQKQSVRKITNIAPDKISYTSVLMAYASNNGKRKSIDAGERAEELLGRITKLYKEGGGGGGGDVKPDTVMYNSVLKVW